MLYSRVPQEIDEFFKYRIDAFTHRPISHSPSAAQCEYTRAASEYESPYLTGYGEKTEWVAEGWAVSRSMR